MEDVATFYACIGKQENGKQCPAFVLDMPYPEHPTWPYLCPSCANQPARKGSTNSNGIVQEKPKK